MNKPKKFFLEQNYPNPFYNTTVFRYHIPKTTDGQLKILNILGQQIRSIENKKYQPGIYYSVWNGADEDGKMAPGGIYFAVFEGDGFQFTKKLIMLQK